ncbi:DUF4214 domain-containing protein [Subtercola boreus]|uniref:DUF4214 domain-containing protein n=1 Tax=Subtercola boreus TaxID=120213 RepID=UPI001559E318|nr:DUF4214 domain-containing protein [Subtercola boreus]
MKKFTAAIAAIVIVGAGFSATPAFATEPVGQPVPLSAQSDRPAAGYTETITPATHPLDLPKGATDAAAAKQAASPNGSTDAVGTGSITGRVVSSVSGSPVSGADVAVLTFTADGDVAFFDTVTADGDGRYTVPGLTADTYWLQFADVKGSLGLQWWGATILNPYGTSVAVADGQARTADWTMSPSGVVQGTVTCEQCTGAPDPAHTSVSIDVPDPNQANHWNRVAELPIDGDGNYISYVIFANTPSYPRYLTFAFNDGSSVHSPVSFGDPFVVTGNGKVTSNVLISHLINPIPGFGDEYGVADNSVVNALYYDFLNRLPSVGEATGWVRLLYNGTPPSAVADGFVNSDEYRLIRIDAAYKNILGRGADAKGRADWLNNMKAGRITTDDIETSFYASQEYLTNHGGTNTSFAAALYKDLLHRDGSPSDWAFWGNLAATRGRDWVIKQFWNERETIGERVTLMYEKYLGRTPDAEGLQHWVNVALAIGDSGLRSGLTSNQEYFIRAQYRYSEV